MKLLVFLLSILLVLPGCSPTHFKADRPSQVTYEPIPPYTLDTTFQKPEKPNFIYLDKNFHVTSKENAVYVCLDQKELAKVVALNTQYNALVDVNTSLVKLVNLHIDEINSFRRLNNIRNQEVTAYIDLYENAQNRVNELAYDLKWETTWSRFMSLASLGLGVGLVSSNIWRVK